MSCCHGHTWPENSAYEDPGEEEVLTDVTERPLHLSLGLHPVSLAAFGWKP